MKAMLLSAAVLVSAAAMANEDTARTAPPVSTEKLEKQAENAVKKVEAVQKQVEKAQLSQSELLDKLHKVSVGHTEMGNLAQTRAKADKVKRLGEKMTKDFARLDQQFVDYAKDHDIVLSDATGMFKGTVKGDLKKGDAKEKFSDLGKLQGESFDRAFLTATTEGCEKFIPMLEMSKGKYEDARFDRVLDKAIDTLKGYQKEALNIGKEYAPAS